MMVRRFSVWTGASISERYQTAEQVAETIRDLTPAGMRPEWLIKAGEVNWQRCFDSHPLAPANATDLQATMRAAARLRVKVSPYVNVRGKPEWNQDEWALIAECVSLSRRTILNVEPGDLYWNGDTTPGDLIANWLDPLMTVLWRKARRPQLEFAGIPRGWVIDDLGGVETINAWLSRCVSAAWECYDDDAPDLAVGYAFSVLEQRGVWGDPQWRIPIVDDMDDVARYTSTSFAQRGLQLWSLPG